MYRWGVGFGVVIGGGNCGGLVVVIEWSYGMGEGGNICSSVRGRCADLRLCSFESMMGKNQATRDRIDVTVGLP